VIGPNGIGQFLGVRTRLVERLLRQLRYAVDLVGPLHVGLSLDYVFDVFEFEQLAQHNPQMVPAGWDIADATSMVGVPLR
jgi:membrane dipeptidase